MVRSWIGLLLAVCLVLPAFAEEEWVEVGADTEAKYYVNTRTLEVDGETIRIQKKAVYTNPLADNFTGPSLAIFNSRPPSSTLNCFTTSADTPAKYFSLSASLIFPSRSASIRCSCNIACRSSTRNL